MTDFNASALQSFRNFQSVTENTMAKVDGGNVVSKGEYSGKFSAITRSGTEKAENNAVRTELLKSLGQAFGLKGMTEENGKVKFSQEFMNKLESLLGPNVFKKSDFGVKGASGEVTGGHPLTSRRISAILNKATIIGKGDFTTADYQAKLDFIKPQLDKISDPTTRERAKAHFEKVGNMLNFLENKLKDDFIDLNWECEMATPTVREAQGLPKWAMKLPDSAQVPLGSKQPINDLLFEKENGGVLVHLENIPRLDEIEDPKVITNYIRNAMQQFIKTSCDIWIDTADNPAVRDKYTQCLYGLSGCMEKRTGELANFVIENHLIGEGVAADHSKDMTLEKVIGKEITAWVTNHPDKAEWEDMVDEITANLKGVERPMVKVTGNDDDGYKFEPLMENGKPVVRPITAEDVASVGKAVYYEVYYGG